MTSPPDQSALVIRQGATWEVYWSVFNPDGSGNPLDLSGWTGRAQIRAWYGAAEALFSWPEDGEIECTSTGLVYLRVNPAQSTAWTWDRGVFGVELVDPDENVVALAQGTVLVVPEVVI